ncbi:STYKc [Musa troglodytarum]|uniref:STYKc n=1 Tax=Musa troglodytarum TaxID=320322 RepID=A0A9E7FTC6_9LILI|nr:STYKc [Musa troglodytarum]
MRRRRRSPFCKASTQDEPGEITEPLRDPLLHEMNHPGSDATRGLQIVRALEGDVSLEDLNEGVRPGQSALFSSGSDYESSPYTSNANRVGRVVVASSEYSAEYSGPSSGGLSGEMRPAESQRHGALPPR